MRSIRLFLLMAVVVLWPAVSDASLLSWLEQLSGPGPFHGVVVSSTVLCGPDTKALRPCLVQTTKTRQTVVVKLGRFRSVDGPRFKDLPSTDADNQGVVHAVPVSGYWLFRVGAFDIGPGAGFLRLSGPGFDPVYKLSLTPLSMSFSPLVLRWRNNPWARVVRLELDTSYFPQGFKGTDFNNTRTSFDSGSEFLTRAGVVVDFGAIANRVVAMTR